MYVCMDGWMDGWILTTLAITGVLPIIIVNEACKSI